jgi:hypothetical protein
MGSRRISILLYGLFMDPDLLRAKGLDPRNPRRARVRGMRLRIGERAALETDRGGEVYGVLVELTHAEIERLYAEPSVAVYRPEAVLAEPDRGSARAALCYNLPSAPAPHERNPEYARRLQELGARLGLPGRYLRTIQ